MRKFRKMDTRKTEMEHVSKLKGRMNRESDISERRVKPRGTN
jgi:hypothetical protein